MMQREGVLLKKGLSPKQMERRFADSLREASWFYPGLKLGAAVSGGADSVALLTLLAEVRSQLGIVLSVVHFNHQLRAKASEADEKFVAALAENLGLVFHAGRGDVAGQARREKANLEDAARRARYAYFDKLGEQGSLDAIATAHTMDDQAETVLAHIFRGTGIPGLAGIHPVAGRIRRPLLGFRRDDLRQYLRARKQAWREDRSNRDRNRTRARMRKTLLPLLLKEFNPAAVEHLAALAERAREQALFVNQLAAQLLEKLAKREAGAVRIGVDKLSDPLASGQQAGASVLRSALVEQIVEQSKARHGQLSSVHVAAVVRLAQSGEAGKRLQLPGGVDVLREHDVLVFRRRS
jgi:tRNA(Ile)-lysidine synthase